MSYSVIVFVFCLFLCFFFFYFKVFDLLIGFLFAGTLGQNHFRT